MNTGGPMDVLTDKRVLLGSPGYKINDLYYSAADSVVDQSEITYSTGRYQYALQGAQFGSSSQIIIPNSSFVGELYLHAELPDLVANLAVGKGWLYGAIQSVSFLLGSSNVPQLTLSGQSIQELAMLECDTQEKRDEVLQLAGQAVRDSGSLSADMVIPLPFSSLCGLVCKKPFDTNILQNPVIVQINFNPASSVYKIITGTPTIPTGFTKAIAYLRQGDLTNKAESLRNLMRLEPTKSLNYPFIHHQSYNPGEFTGSTESSGSFVSIPLQSLINADLVAISFHVLLKSDLNVGAPFKYANISNVRLLYNGLVVYNAPKFMYKLVNLGAGSIGSSAFNYSPPPSNPPPPPEPAPASTVVCYPVLINFSRVKSLIFTNHFANVWRIPNNTLTLEFNTPDNSTYVCYATYHYNGLVQVENGQSNIYFD